LANSSRFKSFNSFIIKRHRIIIVAWVLALALSVTLIPSFFSAVNYNITNTNLSGPKNQESQITQNLMNQEFPSLNNSGGNSIILVVQLTSSGKNVYSNAIKNSLIALNHTVSSDNKESNYTGMSSIYSTEYSLLNSTLPTFVNQTSLLQANVTSLNSNLYQLQSGINQTALLIYGVPAQFLLAWNNSLTPCRGNITCANNAANSTMQSQLPSSSLPYYDGFFQAWNNYTNSLPTISDPLALEQTAINATMPSFLNSLNSNPNEQLLASTTWKGLNVTTWSQNGSIANLAINTIASNLPSSFSSSLGISARRFIQEIYNLGSSPSTTDSWDLASKVFSNATKISFSNSPLFTINSTSLSNLLSELNNKSTNAQISNAMKNVIVTQSYQNYPLVLSKSLTKNFVSSDNSTMIVLFNYSFSPSPTTIDGFRTDTSHSNITALSDATYVTGGPVLSQDLQNVFTPSLGITVVAGVIVSIIIVGLLFLAPLAAIIPLMIGGLSIAIAYASIYVGIVEIGRGQITFLTPTLTTLLMLGLAVDYSVLQLRRTKEERVNGKSKEDSVSTSVRWAGEAVLTAGITVIVAYIVMAVANVPLFSDVGTAIAVGVSILLLASLTLLPSLELSIGDRLFWPSLLRSKGNKTTSTKPSPLEKLSEKTIKHKVAVAIVISLFAAGAVYSAYTTPTGLNFLKLIPNFESNQGLTAITEHLGSAAIAPTVILVTTPTPIVFGHNEWNQTLLTKIELITSTVASTSGVSSITGPTRPYGSPFNYSTIQNMSEPLYSQYLSGMLSDIGKNNKTALILVGLSSSSESSSAVSTLLKIQSEVRSLSLVSGTNVYYGGDTQGTYDSQTFINGILPQVVIILAAAVYVILLLQLRSAFTPLRLVFTILCSVAFALALLSITFYEILNIPIFDFAPLFVVVTMLGVGIDYDIFYVTRIREEVLNGKSDHDAIKTATSKVWVTIFGLGLVLSSVFGSLLVTGIGLLQEISLAVSAAVLIDVAVVILFFVPSLMAIAERFNWWPSKLGSKSQGMLKDRES
jgi:RND superfamily putative drug exporter